ncbi:MAG: DUF2742 domain-containing protein [Gordonia sp. (in: high G+C Gram-positive bacteria)]|uniref:DUF2742 domain-containing protein n=1 Tax=Gordonia sp. (in: high G+C Gram-positive bacteria) TaxID=84139 RepID=UPI003C749B16
MTYLVDWDAVHAFVRRVLRGNHGPLPIAGTPEWQALPDDHPGKVAAVLVAGDRWVLEEERLNRENARAALKEAAVEASQEIPWAAIARAITQRDAFYKSNPDLKRRAS